MITRKRTINQVYSDFYRAEAMEKRAFNRFRENPTPENFEKYRLAKYERVYNEDIINKHKKRFWKRPWEEVNEH